MLSITSDYACSTGDPSPALRRIAAAGFTHVHWCHQWNTDFVYSRFEIEQIARWFCENHLGLLDLHGSSGVEKNWASEREYERLAGVELVHNRMEMAARIYDKTGSACDFDESGGVVIMHALPAPHPARPGAEFEPLYRSLDDLERSAGWFGVRIAIENGDWATIREIFRRYPPETIGLCYDSGHGNMALSNDTLVVPASAGPLSLDRAKIPNGLDELDALRERLISIHLHDNDGVQDLHRLPFSGTVDWPRLTSVLAASAYAKCVSLEPMMVHEGIEGEEEFLARAFETAGRLDAMVRA